VQPSDRRIRIAAALIASAGLGACALAVLSDALGIGTGGSGRGFGASQIALLVAGLLAAVVGGTAFARPRIVSLLIRWWEQTGPEEREIRKLGLVVLVAGLVACVLAIAPDALGLGTAGSGTGFGWKQILLLLAGGVALVLGALLLARPRIVPVRRARGYLRALARQRDASWGTFLLGLMIVLAVYAAVQLTFLKPPSLEGGDQVDYFQTAANLPDVDATHRHLRLGLLLPVRLAIEIFGYSEAAYYALPLLSGLALAGSTYILARMLFGWGVAVAAALLVTLNPYVLWDSSHLLPDVPGTAAFVGAMASLVGAGLMHRREQADARSALLLALAGFLLGWGYLTRESLLIAFPLALVVFYAYRIPWRRIGWVALGAAPALILEGVWGAINYGDPLIRFTTSASPRAADEGELVLDSLDVVGQLPSLFLERSGGWVFVALFLGIMVYGSVAAIRGDRRFLLLVAWTGGMWLLMTLIGLLPIILTGGESALLRLQKFRYWLPLLPGLVIGGLAVVNELMRIPLQRDEFVRPLGLLTLAAFTLVILTVGISSISSSSAFVRNGADAYLQFRDFLRKEGASDSRLYTDFGHPEGGVSTSDVLPMYTRTTFGSLLWQGQMLALSTARFLPVEDIEDGLVVERPASLRDLIEHNALTPPAYLLDPPRSWRPAMISDNGELIVYRVTRSDRLPTPLYTVRAEDWEVIRTDSSFPEVESRFENGRTTVEISDDGSAYVFDGRGANTEQPEGSDHALIDSNAIVWGRVNTATEGDGYTTIRCYFYEQGGAPTVTSAGARVPYTEGRESIDYSCRAPETGGPFDLRVTIWAQGPVTVTLGENTVWRSW
jgi:hypothetical protein